MPLVMEQLGRTQDEELAVLAHWLLGRLATVEGAGRHLIGRDDLDATEREMLGVQLRTALDDCADALRDLAVGRIPEPARPAPLRQVS